MEALHTTQRGPTVSWAGRRVELVRRDTALRAATRRFGFGASYHRPVSVRVTGTEENRIRIHDLVMVARVAGVVAVVLTRVIGRWRR